MPDFNEHNPIFRHNWGFMQAPNSGIFQTLITPQGMVPVIAFPNHEMFCDFVADVIEARDKFVPKVVVDAFLILRGARQQEPYDPNDDPNIGCPAREL